MPYYDKMLGKFAEGDRRTARNLQDQIDRLPSSDEVAELRFQLGDLAENCVLKMIVSSSTATTATLTLSGGVSYRFTEPMTSLGIAAVAADGAEDHVRFSLANGGDVTIPPECDLIPEDFVPEAGKTYWLTATDGAIVIVPCQPGVPEVGE